MRETPSAAWERLPDMVMKGADKRRKWKESGKDRYRVEGRELTR